MKHFLYQLKRVKFKEFIQIWKLIPALIGAFFYRLRCRNLWIVCEDRNEARDNGFWFFKYVRETHPDQPCIYAIAATSPDYRKVAELGPTVEFGTLRHWVLYFASSVKISSQKAGNPNAAIFYLLEVYGIIHNKRVFLQHGVIKDDLKWLYYNVTKMKRFICGAYPEYEYVRDTYGYPEGHVVYTGLCRFDGLHQFEADDKLILIMPTWRAWIADEDARLKAFEGTTDIASTNYMKTWIDFVSDARLRDLAERYGVRFVFFPHRQMQKYIDLFPKSSDVVEIVTAVNYDVQELLKSAAMMITDYSSVFFDMVYMKKPVVFFQFDYEAFRERQYAEGYFHYDDNPFGISFRTKDDVFEETERLIQSRFAVSDEFLRAHGDFFVNYDAENCRRVYDVVKAVEAEEGKR